MTTAAVSAQQILRPGAFSLSKPAAPPAVLKPAAAATEPGETAQQAAIGASSAFLKAHLAEHFRAEAAQREKKQRDPTEQPPQQGRGIQHLQDLARSASGQEMPPPATLVDVRA